MTDLANRYGAPNAAGRRVLVGVIAVVAAAALAWLAWAVVYQSTPKVRSDLAKFEVVDDHTATGLLTVVRRETDTRATCFLRAIAEDHSVVGELDVTVSSGAKTQEVPVTVRTERRATTLEGLGCTAPGQKQRR
jgi:hypothetical protein